MAKDKVRQGNALQIWLRWLAVLAWCAVIYALSATPNLRSEFPNAWDVVLRKIAHVGEYAILTGLFFHAARLTFSVPKSLVYAVLFAVTFALTDEFHQTFVPSRSGKASDWGIDALGVMLAYFFLSGKLRLKYLIFKNRL